MDSAEPDVTTIQGEETVVRPQAGFAPPTPAELAARFPHLEVIELLGHGGMGVVYKGRQTFLDRLVAIKVLRPDLQADGAFQERFLREARTLAKLRHPYHRDGVRRPRGAGSLRPGDGICGRGQLAAAAGGGLDHPAGRPRLRAADDRGPPARPRGRGRPPGHQARERAGGRSGGCGWWISAWPRSSAPRCRRATPTTTGWSARSATWLRNRSRCPRRSTTAPTSTPRASSATRCSRANFPGPTACRLAEGGHRSAPRPHRPPRARARAGSPLPGSAPDASGHHEPRARPNRRSGSRSTSPPRPSRCSRRGPTQPVGRLVCTFRRFGPSIGEADLQVGGHYRLGMLLPGQSDPRFVSGQYCRVDSPGTLSFTWAWEPLTPKTVETQVTLEFHPRGQGTDLVFTHERFRDEPDRNSHAQGWQGCLDRLGRKFGG